MSDQSPSKGRDSRLAVSGWPLRRKVALALAVPLLLAAAFGGLRVTNDLEVSRNSSASADQVDVLEPAIGYLVAGEKGMVAAQSSVGSSQAELDDALVEIRAAAAELEKTRDTANLTFEQRQQVDVILDLSRALREEATGPVSPGTWIAQLRQMQSGVTKLITAIINEQLTPEPRLELLSQTLSGRFSLAQQQALAASDRTGRSVEVSLFAELGAESVALDRLAGQRGVPDASIQTLRINNGGRAREAGTGVASLGGDDAYDEYDTIQTSLLDAVKKQLTDNASTAQSSALLNALLTLVALAAAIALAFLISRTLVNPIRRVREGALKVAQQDLPDAVARIRSGSEPGPITRIDVTTHEEVGQLARAVDDLHQQAVTLASGEAKLRTQVGEMFVTLSRRNTTLINQQLNLIEALESDEEDPKRLESLFRLDHLAARMRRTADSLLILADAPTRSAGWESVSIGETLQAATAGVTDYQRVRIDSDLPVLVNEAAAGDLVHMVTEIVDNSLSYSSPHTSVVLDAIDTDNGVTISVSDAGLGIPVEELKQINENLRTGVEVTPDTARRMGLFVVSRLAQRHGVSVTLKANAGDGTTAYVLVPNAILPSRAHIEPVPVEEEVPEEVVEETQLEDAAIETEGPSVDLVEESDDSDDDTELTAPTPLPVRGSADPEVDASDPLGLGDSHLAPSLGLPTRERGATLSHLTAAGLQVSTGDETAEPEEPREIKRATGGMALRSKRDLTAAPAVVAVPDLPKDDVDEADEAVVDETIVDESVVDESIYEDFLEEPIAAEEPVEDEIADEPAAAEEPVEVPEEPVAVEEPVEDEIVEPAPEAVVVEVEPEPETTPESHIAALMAKIRPQRGRLPIPDYEDVDHAAILQMPSRDRGALGDPLTDPLPLEEDEVAAAVEAPVEAAEESWVETTTEAPAAHLFSESVFDTETAPTYSEAIAEPEPEQPAPSPDHVEEPALNGSAKSSWLSTDEEDRAWTSTEVEAGWARADTVAETHDEATNDSGLPVRRPGARLVPGSVTKPVGAAGRDPEAIRARLSAHKAGVRRGRTASVSADDQ
ncbi:MAG: sensor histidine kinase [Nocardioides sp.]|uniref:sensor histidine kinase n=1 Tax=Nocardioides sp. TaxID=35761 RepID=UPI003262DBD5